MRRLVIVSACVLVAAFALAPFALAIPNACAFRMVTGRPCIFCGMTHAMAFAVRGDFITASAAHPLWFVVLPLFALFAGAMVARYGRVSWVLVGVFVVGTVWRAVVA